MQRLTHRHRNCLYSPVTHGLLVFLMMLGVPAFGQRVKSVTVPDLRGRMVSFRVFSSPGLNNIAKADLAGNLILVNWERLLSYNPSPQLVQLVLAHEAGHLLQRDTSQQREQRADYFAGRTMRIEGYTSRDMDLVGQEMRRILGRGDATHPPSEQRVQITMRGYNSIAAPVQAQTQPVTTQATQTQNPTRSGGWRHFGQNSLR